MKFVIYFYHKFVKLGIVSDPDLVPKMEKDIKVLILIRVFMVIKFKDIKYV